MCALGKDHSLFLTNDGIVMACGSNGYGQLGIGQGHDGRSIPTLINGLNDIKALSAGYYHSMALNSAGNLYAWGSGSWGKLGLSSDANCATPRLVSALKSVPTRSVACGGHHTVAITVAGDVWTWGKGLHGQLGHNSIKVAAQPSESHVQPRLLRHAGRPCPSAHPRRLRYAYFRPSVAARRIPAARVSLRSIWCRPAGESRQDEKSHGSI
jgi:alpha-tubulin suppressor-like RCC1 family protein